MNMLHSMGRSLGIAHLAKVSTKAADEDKKPEDEKEDKAKVKKSEDEETKPADDKEEDKQAAEDKPDDEHEEPDGDEPKAAEGEDDEDGDEEDGEKPKGKSAFAEGRRAERSRCSAILGSEFAARNMALAQSLAFKTTMSSKTAIEVLRSTPAATVVGHSNRQASNPKLGTAGEVVVQSAQAMASSWDSSFRKWNSRAKS